MIKSEIIRVISVLLVLEFIFPNLIFAKERLAVMSLKAKGEVPQELADTISVEMRNQIQKFGMHEVISKEDMDTLAERTAAVQKAGCEENLCLITFGNQLNSRYMVAGSLAKLEEKYHIGIRILDTEGENAGVRARASRDCSCSEDELLKLGRVLSAELLYNYQRGMAPGKDVSSEERDEYDAKLAGIESLYEHVKDENIIDEDRSWFWRYKWWILGGIVIAAAGAAAAGGGGGSSSDPVATPAGSTQPTGPVGVSW